MTEEAMADYSFDKMIKSDDRATSMELIHELGGYSVGSGMLSQDNAILRGLKAVKLKEEDPLVIGFIIRKGFTAHMVENMVILPAKMSNRLLSVNWRKSY